MTDNLHDHLAIAIQTVRAAQRHVDLQSTAQKSAREYWQRDLERMQLKLSDLVLEHADTILAALAHKPPPDATLAERLAWFEGAGRAAFEANADIFIDNVTAVMDTAEHGEQ